ncbi:MAG: hypothetical protein [Bacteriophage sp.]|nr:MAG: hypothetical protein [Bacteriophage sp.]
MKKSKFVKELERIIDMVKAEDDGFEYGGKVIFYKEDDDNYEISVKSIEMNLMVEANTMASMDDRIFACLMSEIYKQKFTKAITISEDEDDEDN